jgi:hypothetical protein
MKLSITNCLVFPVNLYEMKHNLSAVWVFFLEYLQNNCCYWDFWQKLKNINLVRRFITEMPQD